MITFWGDRKKTPPLWNQIPDSLVRVKPGSFLKWKCIASGNPKPVIKWFRKRKLLTENETLTLGPINATDEDIYECIAKNEAGTAAKEVQLYVTGGLVSDYQKWRYYRLETNYYYIWVLSFLFILCSLSEDSNELQMKLYFKKQTTISKNHTIQNHQS